MLRHKRQAAKEAKPSRQRQQEQRSQRRFHDDDDDEEGDQLLEDRWRQAAQLLTDEDELRLFGGGPSGEPTEVGAARSNRVAQFEEEDDDNSSISFAQSGCHSILSAWRLKAAHRATSRQSRRPISVLSNGSSTGKRSAAASVALTARSSLRGGGKSPAAQTRIPLGPTSAQHFVTNTRRRRRANELILTTMEARRRALALNRQNASLLGSASYLAGGSPTEVNEHDDYRLSMSPSPLIERTTKCPPSPRLSPAKVALSDLGAVQHRATAEAQRNRLLLASAKQLRHNLRASESPGGKQPASHHQSASVKRPPLAKLDQNSSDLNTTNSSSSGSESSSSSSGSQFTQLVTSELVAPDCDLLEQREAIRARLNPPVGAESRQQQHRRSPAHSQQRRPPVVGSPARSSPQKPPRAPERIRRAKPSSPSERSPTSPEPQAKLDQTLAGSEKANKLRRGALRRDSIRRLRLTRSAAVSSEQQRDESSSSDVAAPSSDSSMQQTGPSSPRDTTDNNARQFQALSKARRLDIESNPFLNRHHFRTTSVRSNSTGRGSEIGEGASSPAPPAPTNRPANLGGSLRDSNSIGRIFGLASRPSTNSAASEQERTIKRVEREPRMFSQARRANATEQVAGSGDHKAQEEVRQVERMLREMKPNQVFSSYRLKEKEDSATMRSSETGAQPQQRKRESDWRQQSFNSRLREHHTVSHENRSLATSGGQHEQSRSKQQYREAIPSTVPNATREATNAARFTSNRPDGDEHFRGQTTSNRQPVVSEGSRSRDDLKFDRMGNKRQCELAESWRREQTTSPTSDEERFTSKRMELIRSTSISPPLAFADPAKQRRSDTHRPPQPSSPKRVTEAQKDNQQAYPRYQTRLVVERPASHQTAPSGTRRSASEERPTVATRNRALAASASQHTQPRQVVGTSGRPAAQASLPKFEDTAEDEFRKRVDYLRKLARANISSEPVLGEATKRKETSAKTTAAQPLAAERPPPVSRTKPISINWRQEDLNGNQRSFPKSSNLSSTQSDLLANDERAKWNFGPLAERPAKPQARTTRNMATTNLDLALLADRYQTRSNQLEAEAGPVSALAGKWRRSNSSLASIGSRSAGTTKPPQRATSPLPLASLEPRLPAQKSVNLLRPLPQGNQVVDQQARPAELTSSAVVKLVVKEKSAPELDFAFVEQQPVVQTARQMAAPQAKQLGNMLPARPQQVSNQQRPSSLINKQRSLLMQQSYPDKLQQEKTQANSSIGATRIRSPLRVASPRSPEFGNMAASSNDDSAIASSVSSPSLSFMLNTAGGEQPVHRVGQPSLPTGGRSASPSSLAQRSVSQQNSGKNYRKPVDNSSGVLQSILRRHQQQNQHLQSTGYSSDSSNQVVTGSSSGALSCEPTRKPANRPEEPLFRSDARSPELQVSSAPIRQVPMDEHSDGAQQAPADSSSPPKRVHFNDRTSIRSFESISSLVSNSTAVPNNNLLIRQQVGSPDSLGSGSTSRLSAESPELRRAGSLGSGAAIYAVRGDPELEVAQERALQRQHILGRPIEVAQATYTNMARQPAAAGNPMLCNPIARYDPANQAFIRMTAPPSISTSSGNFSPRTLGGPLQARPVQYIVRPTSMTSTQIVPTMVGNPMQVNRMNLRPDEDDEEPDYALRLRQAATNRVFSYVDGLAASASPQRHMSPTVGQQVRQQQHQQQQANRRLAMEDLLNFQTEV